MEKIKLTKEEIKKLKKATKNKQSIDNKIINKV